MKRSWFAAAAFALAGMQPVMASAQSADADVALVLAVDVSGSVDEGRFKLQREGIAASLESEAFAAALSGGIHQTVEIAVVEWAEEQQTILPWTILHRRDDISAAANQLRAAPRSSVHVLTDPAGGIAAADRLLASVPLPAGRKVIDVSGDGKQNSGEVPTASARDAAVSHGVTVNGLPITSGDEPHVDEWYRANVIGGPGAFLVVADGHQAFADAFRQKLTLEVAGVATGPTLAAAYGRKLFYVP
jgi:Protein of unknown function (DUF1194)